MVDWTRPPRLPRSRRCHCFRSRLGTQLLNTSSSPIARYLAFYGAPAQRHCMLNTRWGKGHLLHDSFEHITSSFFVHRSWIGWQRAQDLIVHIGILKKKYYLIQLLESLFYSKLQLVKCFNSYSSNSVSDGAFLAMGMPFTSNIVGVLLLLALPNLLEELQ